MVPGAVLGLDHRLVGGGVQKRHGRGIELVMKSVLCVISHFPPDAATGAHRARAIARRLPAHGWRPVGLRRYSPGSASISPWGAKPRRRVFSVMTRGWRNCSK